MLVTNQDYQQNVTLKINDSQFRINDAATVRARVKSSDGQTAYTSWVTFAKNDRAGTDWGISKLDLLIPSAQTALVKGTSAKLDINIQGTMVDRDGNTYGDAYNTTWTQEIKVEQGIA